MGRVQGDILEPQTNDAHGEGAAHKGPGMQVGPTGGYVSNLTRPRPIDVGTATTVQSFRDAPRKC